MTDLGLDEWMVAWDPGGDVAVGSYPDRTGWSRPYSHAIMCPGRGFEYPWKVAQMLLDFHTLVVRDGIDPQQAHREFLKIDEYRRRIAPDIPGAARRGGAT